MKISEFSKKTGLSIDAIRYYIELGLLSPRKINTKFVFCISDIEIAKNISSMKALGLDLSEMKNYLYLAELRPFIDLMTVPNFKAAVEKSKTRAEQIIKEQKKIISNINERISESNKSKNAEHQPGLSLDNINLFSYMGQPFTLDAEKIKNNQIIQGRLICGDKVLTINEGVVLDSALYFKVDMGINENLLEVFSIKDEQLSAVMLYSNFIEQYIYDNFQTGKNILVTKAEETGTFPKILSTLSNDTIVLSGHSNLISIAETFLPTDNKLVFYISNERTFCFKEKSFDCIIVNFDDDSDYCLYNYTKKEDITRLVKDDGRIVFLKLEAEDKGVLSYEDFENKYKDEFILEKLHTSDWLYSDSNDMDYLPKSVKRYKLSIVIAKRRVTQR